MKIKELLTDETKWYKGQMALDNEGKVVDYNHPRACKWCLYGAIDKCYLGDRKREQIEDKIRSFTFHPICSWNDSIERTFKDVKDLVEKLDI